MSDIKKIIEFHKIVEKLGQVKRDVKLSDGSYESDSSHILKVAYLAFAAAPYLQTKVDTTKMFELALVHDLAEAECGDIPLCAQRTNTALQEQKKQKELAAIERCRDILPQAAGEKIYNLFMEYENKSSREAQIVYVLDKLDANYQACRLGDVLYWSEGKGGDWYYRCVMSGDTPEKQWLEKLNEPLLSHMEAQCLNLCRMAMIKSGVRTDEKASQLNDAQLPLNAALADFMDVVEKLALVKRDNRLADGSKETAADHIVKLCYLLLCLSPYLQNPGDYGRLLRLALTHDLPEAVCGRKLLKKKNEAEAVTAIRHILPAPLNQQIYELCAEYAQQQTAESRLLKLVNKLEGALQNAFYQDSNARYWEECEGVSCQSNLQINSLLEELNDPLLNELHGEITRLCFSPEAQFRGVA